MIQAGKLRHRVDIQQLTGSTADGYGNTRKSWTNLYTSVPVHVVQVGSRELWNADRATTRSSHRVYSRYLPNLAATQRIVWGSRTFTIDGIITDEKQTQVEILATEQI